MEYEIGAFTNRLRFYFVASKQMPIMGEEYTDLKGNKQLDSKKHPNRPTPRDLRSQISNCIDRTYLRTADTQISFDIGDDYMENYFPYYHILQQAPTISKRNRATDKTRGSMYGKPARLTDYEYVSWNGKSFTKEYSKNVRGSRMNLNKVQYRANNMVYNESAKRYLNVHYNFIDKIIEEIVPIVASDYELKVLRKQNDGLGDEMFMQIDYDSFLDDFEEEGDFYE